MGVVEGEVEQYGDDCGLVSNSPDQMTLQYKSRSVGWNLKIELTTPTIKALWSLVLVFKWLVILLLNNVLVRDCSMKQQYCLLYLKVLALIFVCKLNKGAPGSLSRCGCSLNVAALLGLCGVINAHIRYSVILMELSQEAEFVFFKTIKE